MVKKAWRKIYNKTIFGKNACGIYWQIMISFEEEQRLFRPYVELFVAPKADGFFHEADSMSAIVKMWSRALLVSCNPDELVNVEYNVDFASISKRLMKGHLDFEENELNETEKKVMEKILFKTRLRGSHGFFRIVDRHVAVER